MSNPTAQSDSPDHDAPLTTAPSGPATSLPQPVESQIERGEVVVAEGAEPAQSETITEPGKVMRIGSMVKQLLEEVRSGSLDEASRERVAEIYERSIVELQDAMSPDLQDELRNLALPFPEGTIPSESELRVAKAQLVGWLEGLFHGIQATLFAQQLAARQQFDQMRGLPPGVGQAPGQAPGQDASPQMSANDRPGTYL